MNNTASVYGVYFSIDIANHTPSRKVTETIKLVTFPVEIWSTEVAATNFRVDNTTLHRFPKFGELIRTVSRAFSDLVTCSSVH